MDQPREEPSGRPMAERAEELGERVGRLASLALRRIESVTRQGISGPPSPAASEAPDREAPQGEATGASDGSATERAERLLDGMGERVNQLASVTGPSIRRFVALAREEMEDIWAEAQHIRQSNGSDSD